MNLQVRFGQVEQTRLFDRRFFPIGASGGVFREPLSNRFHSFRDYDDVGLRLNRFVAQVRLNDIGLR